MISLLQNTGTLSANDRTAPVRGMFLNRAAAPSFTGADTVNLQFGFGSLGVRFQVAQALAKVLKEQGLTEEQAFNRPKRDRIGLFLQVLKNLPPADSFNTAHQQMDAAMRSIEQKARSYGMLTMSVDHKAWYAPITPNTRLSTNKNHTSFIGNNGAIAIYYDPDDVPRNPAWFQQEKPVFQKSGKDGRDIWGKPPSPTLRFGQRARKLDSLAEQILAETIQEQGLTEEQAFNRPKRDRIGLFMEVLQKLPPADSFHTAHQQMDAVMESIENKAQRYGVDEMVVNPADTYNLLHAFHARYLFYTEHVNVIGHNGAIAIYATDDNAARSLNLFRQQEPAFQKPGRDGRDVWGRLVVPTGQTAEATRNTESPSITKRHTSL